MAISFVISSLKKFKRKRHPFYLVFNTLIPNSFAILSIKIYHLYSKNTYTPITLIINFQFFFKYTNANNKS